MRAEIVSRTSAIKKSQGKVGGKERAVKLRGTKKRKADAAAETS